MGAGRTTIVPVWQGYTVQESISSLNIGGDDVTDYVFKITIFAINLQVNYTT